jgi:hypothetical protein
MAITLLTSSLRWVDFGNNGGAGFPFLNGALGSTLCAWINTTRVTGLPESIVGVSIGPAGGTTNSSRMRLGLDTGVPFLIGRNLDGVSNNTVSAGSAVSVDTWTHVAGTYDCITRLATLYINAVSVGSGTFTNSTSAAFSATNCKNGSIGAGVLGTDNWFDGQLADVRIYQAALSIEELKTIVVARGRDGIRKTNATPGASVLQLRYPFDDAAPGVVCTTSNLRDVSGAQLVASPFAVNGSPVFAGHPLSFRRAA